MIIRNLVQMQSVAAGIGLCLLAACTSPLADRAAEPGTPNILDNAETEAALPLRALEGRWKITAFDGQPPAQASAERPPSVAFAQNGYGATAGCNALGGIGALHGDRYYTMPGPQTLIGCMGDLARQEQLLDAVMRASPTISKAANDELILAGGGHRLTLRRDAQSPPPAREPAPVLAGARFQIQSVDGVYLTPRSQSDNRPLAFDAGEWRAKPVCGTITGQWRQDGRALHATDIALAREGCDPSGAAIDTAIRDLFAFNPHFSTGPNGEILIAGGGHWIAAERDVAALERDTPRLAGSWDIVQLDERPLSSDTPGIAPRLDFAATNYGGSTGCNSILGNFVVRGGRFYTNPGPTTEKGCGPLSAQESRIYALLRGAPRIGRAGGDVHLIDATGSMMIRRTNRPANAAPVAAPLSTRYAGTALSLNGEPVENRVTDPASRVTIAGNEIRIDIGCGPVSAIIRRGREGLSIVSNAGSSDGANCTDARLVQHNLVMRIVNGPAAGIVDSNGDLLLAGEGVWLTARRDP